MNTESHESPNLGETAEALADLVDALDDKDRARILFQMAYGGAEVQRTLTDQLTALAAWKRDNPQVSS